MAMVMLGMLCIAGCGGPESEYESIRREFHTIIGNGKKPVPAMIDAEMKEFRAMSPEEQKKRIASAKEDLEVIKSVAEKKKKNN